MLMEDLFDEVLFRIHATYRAQHAQTIQTNHHELKVALASFFLCLYTYVHTCVSPQTWIM
jgi:hypothetical protein